MNTNSLTKDERTWLNLSKSILSGILESAKELTRSQTVMAHHIEHVISGICMYAEMTCQYRFRNMALPPEPAAETAGLIKSFPDLYETVRSLDRLTRTYAIPSDFPSDATISIVHNSLLSFDLINKLVETQSTTALETDVFRVHNTPLVAGDYIEYLALAPAMLIALTEPAEYDPADYPRGISADSLAYALEYIQVAKTCGAASIHETLAIYEALRTKHRANAQRRRAN